MHFPQFPDNLTFELYTKYTGGIETSIFSNKMHSVKVVVVVSSSCCILKINLFIMIKTTIQTDNSSNSLQRLNRLIAICITGLITLCLIILAFAIQQTLIARGTQTDPEFVFLYYFLIVLDFFIVLRHTG